MKEMRGKMERFVVLPFAGGCVSHSSVAVVEHQSKRSKPDQTDSLSAEDEKTLTGANLAKNSTTRFLAVPRPNISNGIQKLVRGFKGFSQLFVYVEEMEEMEIEMEIGSPTDVKHLTHIGWEGAGAANNPLKAWDSLISAELFSLPPVPPLKQ